MPPTHRRSPSPELTSIQANVLSAFTHSSASHHSSDHVGKRRKLDPQQVLFANKSSASNLCDDLCCTSTDDGASRLLLLKRNLKNRKYSPTQLATQLFMCDQVDTGPPLCATVNILRERWIHLKDISPPKMIERAVIELRNPDTCSCRGRKSGLQALIRFILEESHSSERDSFLRHFLSVLFLTNDSTSLTAQKKDRFRLAEHTLCVLRESVKDRDEDLPSLQEWIRKASLPTRAATEDGGRLQSDVENSQWTPELTGLGTGRSPWEYLTNGKEEERALVSLFKIVSPVVASRVYLECVHSVLNYTKSSAKLPRRARGCWSRVVILGRRVLDTSCFADADPELRASLQSSLNGVLTSAVSLKAYHDVAVLICLFRCILVPPEKLKEGSSNSQDFKDYEKWLTDFASNSQGTALVTLLEALTDLVPLEPLHMLRVNHRVLSLKRERARLSADYLVSVRGRISDLKPANSELFTFTNKKGDGDDALNDSAATEEDVIQFILDYSTSKKIPSVLVRKMNFHRHFFRTRILKSILDPELGVRFSERRFNGQVMNSASFDGCRIAMIKELAFNRKDKAVSVTEANEAIAAILAAKHRNVESKDSKQVTEAEDASPVTDLSSTLEVCKAILAESYAGPDKSDISRDAERAPIPTSIRVLVKKITDMWQQKSKTAERSEVAADLIHSMLTAISEANRMKYQTSFGDMFEHTPDSALRTFTAWWDSHGARLLQAIRYLLDSSAGRELERVLQYQLVGVLCAREEALPRESMISLAMLSMCVAKVGGTVALMDTLMMSQQTLDVTCADFLSCLTCCLPLGGPDAVACAASFAIHCICLHITYTDKTTLPLFRDHTSQRQLPEAERERGSVSVSRAHLTMLGFLRWLVGHPWRLSLFPARRDTRFRIEAPERAFSIISFAARLLVSPKIPIPHDFTIEQYVSIEERCGWGRVGSVYEELRRREVSGAHPLRLICQFALELSKRDSSGWPAISWMERGLTRYAEEKTSNCTAGFSAPMNSGDAPRFLERSVSTGQTEVGLRLVDAFERMRFCYFHGYSGADMGRHLTYFLVPWYWPFSTHLAKYLWDCMNRRCLAWESEHCIIKENVLVLCSFSLCCSICSEPDNGAEVHLLQSFAMGGHTNDVIYMISELRKAMEETSAFDDGMDGESRTQIATRPVSRALLPANLTRAFGSCFVLGLAKKCQMMNRSLRPQRIRAWIGEVETVVDEANMSEFLMTAISVASFLPFTRFVEEHDRKDQVFEITNEILIELFERHFLRLADGSGPFHWTRVPLQGVPMRYDDIRIGIDMWIGASNGSNITTEPASLSCLPVDVCMARLYERMSCLCEESLRHVVSKIGSEGVSNCLIPNILSTCRRLPSNDMGTTATRLSKLSKNLFDERKGDLAREMVATTIKLMATARAALDNFGEAAIARSVAQYPEFREQVISGVRAKQVNVY